MMIAREKEKKNPIKAEVKIGERGRKLTHKSKLQSKALWAIFNLYNGEVPEKHCMTRIASELAIDRTTVTKWFWDKRRYYTKKMQRIGKTLMDEQ